MRIADNAIIMHGHWKTVLNVQLSGQQHTQSRPSAETFRNSHLIYPLIFHMIKNIEIRTYSVQILI